MSELSQKEKFHAYLRDVKKMDPNDLKLFRAVAVNQLYDEFERATASEKAPKPEYVPPAKASLPAAYSKLSAADQLRFLNGHQAHAAGHLSDDDFAALSRKLGMTTESAS